MTETTIQEELSKEKTVIYYTVGTSMRPLLSERSTHVFLEPSKELSLQDIVLYVRENGSLVLHRLMKREGQQLFMRGDNTYALEPIHQSRAIGVVSRIYRKGRYIDVKTSRGYQCYVAFWKINYPLRLFFVKLKGFLRRYRK